MNQALDQAASLEDFLGDADVAELAGLLFGQGGEGFPQAGEDFSGDFGGFSFGGFGSDDVSLIYSDEDYDSYANIFDNAKTDVTDADKDRLIDSLRQLNEQQNLEQILDMDEVIRYFVVHNFVCNFDSYTGSMIHNYYLYEEDGALSMIPWDYNLAFGGFMSSQDATSLVNYPIDTPVSGGSVDSRPMLAWIFSDEEYTQLYHEYFSEFLACYFESGYFEEMMQQTYELIAPYVEKDPTKFCSYEEFETGFDTLVEFCQLRAQSVRGQLEGTVPSTSEGQQQADSQLVDASDLNISDMGSMGGGMGGGMDRGMDRGQGGWEEQAGEAQAREGQSEGSESQAKEPLATGFGQPGGGPGGGGRWQTLSGEETPSGQAPEDGGQAAEPPEDGGDGGQAMEPPEDGGDGGQAMEPPEGGGGRGSFEGGFDVSSGGNAASGTGSGEGWALTGICAAVLLAGILVAFFYPKRA